MADKKRGFLTEFALKGVEEAAFMLDLFRLPVWQSKKTKFIRESLKGLNRTRVKLGLKPKRYKRVGARGVVEEIC